MVLLFISNSFRHLDFHTLLGKLCKCIWKGKNWTRYLEFAVKDDAVIFFTMASCSSFMVFFLLNKVYMECNTSGFFVCLCLFWVLRLFCFCVLLLVVVSVCLFSPRLHWITWSWFLSGLAISYCNYRGQTYLISSLLIMAGVIT